MSSLRFNMSMAVLTTAFAGVLSSTPTYAATPADACFTMSGSTITAYTVGGANGCPTNVDIPATVGGASVTAIGVDAFRALDLTAVTFPSSLTTIGTDAFAENLFTAIVVPDTITTMGTAVFGNMPSLTSATWNTTMTTIPANTFNSSGLTSFTVPAQVTTIGDAAFAYSMFTSFTIPSTVTTIGIGSFQGNQLTSVTLPDSVRSLGVAAFLANDISSLTIGSGLATIPQNAFMMNSLATVTIPSTVTTIAPSAFGMQFDDPVAYHNAVFAELDDAVAAAQYATMYYTQLFTADPSNPAGLTDGVTTDIESSLGDRNGNGVTDAGVSGGGHIVNPTSVTLNFRDTAGATVAPTIMAVGQLPDMTYLTNYLVADGPVVADGAAPTELSAYYRTGKTFSYTAPIIGGITPTPASYSYTLAAAAAANERTFVYAVAPAAATPVLAETGINSYYVFYSAAALLLAAAVLLITLKQRHA